MSTKKIIFLDIDGTLIDYAHNLPASAEEAISRARSNGHKLIISTGRSKPSIYPWLLEMGFDGLIAGEGAYVEYAGKVILESTIPQEHISRLYQYLNDRKVGFYEESNSGTFANRYFLSESARVFGVSEPAASAYLREAFASMTFDHESFHLDDNKLSFAMTPLISKAELEKEFGADFRIGVWNIFGKDPSFGDFAQKHLTKASAVAVLLDELNLDREDTFAFGDSSNDLAILQYCQTGVAMGNAEDEVKAVADYVTSDVTEDGIFNAFRQFNLI